MIAKVLKKISIFLVWFLILEIGSRAILKVKIGLPFFTPEKLLTDVVYPELGHIKSNYKPGKEYFNILLLGGSVINHKWSDLENSLEKNVQGYTNQKVNVYNLSMPGHNSLDNLVKYELLGDYSFDAVVYYESINETRVNNIDSIYFKDDYSHISWYRNYHLFKKHHQLKISVIPFFLEYIVESIKLKLNQEKYILEQLISLKNFDKVSPLKSTRTFKTNLLKINEIAAKKNEPLILCTYAYYVPLGIKLSGKVADRKFYSECSLSTPVTNWGNVENTLKSLQIQNEIIRLVTKQESNVIGYEVTGDLEVGKLYFCDICHMTPEGNELLSNGISNKIIKEVLGKNVLNEL